MTKIILPKIDTNIYNACINLGLTVLQANIVASRTTDFRNLERIVSPRISNLESLETMYDCTKAALLISSVIRNNGRIMIVSDYDSDGVTSAFVLHNSLVEYFNVPIDNVSVLINERINNNGVNDTLIGQILDANSVRKIDLVITSDHGTSDGIRLTKLMDAGIKVCLTDHHLLPNNGAPIVDCFVNPQNPKCDYDTGISGCAVAYLVMCAVRMELMFINWLDRDAKSLKGLLPIVAISTIADAMPLDKPNNRAFVKVGFKDLNTMTNPLWQALKIESDITNSMNEETVSFNVAPKINAASRMGNVYEAFDFLNSKTREEASNNLERLNKVNDARRQLQQHLIIEAKEQLPAILDKYKYSISIFLNSGFGLQGIVSSNIGEKHSRPIVSFVHLDDVIAGSGRSIIPQFHMRNAFKWIEKQDSSIFIAYGGHSGAAGCKIHKGKEEAFKHLFDLSVKQQIGDGVLDHLMETDGSLTAETLVPGIVKEINEMGPYGIKWRKPKFVNDFEIVSCKAVGADKSHLSLVLLLGGARKVNAIYLGGNEPNTKPIFSKGNVVEVVYTPNLNSFMGRIGFQLFVHHMN